VPLLAGAVLLMACGASTRMVHQSAYYFERCHAADLDDEPLDRAWVTHAEIANGARLHLMLGDEPTGWGTEDLPPNGL